MAQEVIEVVEREVEVIEVIERGPQGPQGEAPSLNWNDIENKPSEFPPEPHTHTPSEVGLSNVSNIAQVTDVSAVTPITSSGGTTPSISITEATTVAAGSMSAADKIKLNGIANNANNYIHPNHTGEVTSSGDGSTAIANDVVTNAKLANVASQSIKGRATSATGDPEDLSASQVRTILNVADGATANAASNTIPQALGVASAGTGTPYAREDHVHPISNVIQSGSGFELDTFTVKQGGIDGYFLAKTFNTIDPAIGIESYNTSNVRVGFALLGTRGSNGFLQGSSSSFRIEKAGGSLSGLFVEKIKLEAGTSSSPAIFSSISNSSGLYWASDKDMRVAFGGIDNIRIQCAAPRILLRGDGDFAFGGGPTTIFSPDLFLRRGDSGTLDQHNGANPQTFRLYNTYTNASNYERGFISWVSNTLRIGTEAAGTGTLRDTEIWRGTERLAQFTRTAGNNMRLTLYRPDGASSQSTILESQGGGFRVLTNGTLRFSVDGANNIISGAEGTSSFLSNTFPNARNTIFFGGGSVPSFRAIDGHFVEIYGGDADAASGTDRDGGPVTIRGGKRKGGGAEGSVLITTSTGTNRIQSNGTGLGFFAATPVAQPAAIADATDAATTQARLNDLLAAIRSLGLIAT